MTDGPSPTVRLPTRKTSNTHTHHERALPAAVLVSSPPTMDLSIVEVLSMASLSMEILVVVQSRLLTAPSPNVTSLVDALPPYKIAVAPLPVNQSIVKPLTAGALAMATLGMTQFPAVA